MIYIYDQHGFGAYCSDTHGMQCNDLAKPIESLLSLDTVSAACAYRTLNSKIVKLRLRSIVCFFCFKMSELLG